MTKQWTEAVMCLAFCWCVSANILTPDIAENLYKTTYKRLIDARSKTYKQIYGIFYESQPIEEVAKESITRENSIILVDNDRSEYCDIACYFGPLSVFDDKNETLIEYPTVVDYPALKVLLEQNRIVFIDVRNRSELISPGKIPGSVNVPLHEIPQAFELSEPSFKEKYGFELPETTAKNIVLTCRSGRRILTAKREMETLGYLHLRLYIGSFKDWKKNGGKILKGAGAISR